MMKKQASKKPPQPDLTHPIHFLAFGFGTGCSPKAPGTLGTLAAVGLYVPLSNLPEWGYLLVVFAVVMSGIAICDWSARQLNVHDHPGIVWDEIAGYLITMIAAPDGGLWILLGFALFRLFDILKPWPISYLDRQIGGGLGIMLDDVAAGLAAFGLMQLIATLI